MQSKRKTGKLMTIPLRPPQTLQPFSFNLRPPASRSGQRLQHGLQGNQCWVSGLLLLTLCCGGAQAAPLPEQGGEAEALTLRECGLGDFAAVKEDLTLNPATHAALVSALLESFRELQHDPLEPATRARVLQALVSEFHFFTYTGNPQQEARAARTPKIAVFAAEYPLTETERVLYALSRLERDLAPPQEPEGDGPHQNSSRPNRLLAETILRHFMQAILQTRGPQRALKILQHCWLQDRPEVLKRWLQVTLQDAVIRSCANQEDPQLADLFSTLPASDPGFDAAAAGDLLRHPDFLAATLKERLQAWFSPTTASPEAERHAEFCRVLIQHLPQIVHESEQASSVYRQGQHFVERQVQNFLPDSRALSIEQRTLRRALHMKVGAYQYFGSQTFPQARLELPPHQAQGGGEVQDQGEHAAANQLEHHVHFDAPSSMQARQASTSDLPAASASLPPP